MARAAAEQSVAEAKSREAHSKARIATIDLVEGLLDKGVREGDFAQWTRILGKAKLPVEALTNELESFGSLELLCNDRVQRAKKLKGQVEHAEASLKALRKEEGNVRAAIGAVRDGALKEMERTGRTARQHLDDLLAELKEHDELRRAAEGMQEELALARAFMSRDQNEWNNMPEWVVQRLVLGLILWSRGEGRNILVSPPEPVRIRYSWLMPRRMVTMIDLLMWVLVGMQTKEGRQSFARVLSSR